MKQIAMGLMAGILLLSGIGWYAQVHRQATNAHEQVHLHAGFQVYRDNILLDFSGFEYMTIVSCNEDGEPVYGGDNHVEKTHLHNGVGDVVHVHQAGVAWQDLFDHLEVTIDASASAYLNGKLVEDYLDRIIEPYDSLVVLEGVNDQVEAKLAGAVTRPYIERIESQPEACGLK